MGKIRFEFQKVAYMSGNYMVDEIEAKYERNADNILCSKEAGYWSNLDEVENNVFIEYLKDGASAREAVINKYPEYHDIIFSPKREAGLELLELEGDETCVDYGCMWGALTTALAKRTRFVLSVDQTLQSLIFLRRRIEDENIKNIELLCENLKMIPVLENKFDVAVVNGVLEWIPEEGKVELKRYYGKRAEKRYSHNPQDMQIDFLKKVYRNLNAGGKLYLSIENRYDFKMFFGVRDPHANLLFTSILPRKIASFISMRKLGRPYINWLYSFSGLRSMLTNIGFNIVNLYACFPDYRFPEFISPYEQRLEGFRSTIPRRNKDGKIKAKRVAGFIVEAILFRYLKATFFAPSIIAIGRKK